MHTCTACQKPIPPGTTKFLLGSPYCSADCLSQHYQAVNDACEAVGAEVVDLGGPTPCPNRTDLTDDREPPTVHN